MKEELRELREILKSELDVLSKQQQLILESMWKMRLVLQDLLAESQRRKAIKHAILKYWYLSLVPAVYMIAGSKAVEDWIKMFL